MMIRTQNLMVLCLLQRAHDFIHAAAAQPIGISVADPQGVKHRRNTSRSDLGVMTE